nr:hypothetical protein CFP56_24078 [Quercus suber]
MLGMPQSSSAQQLRPSRSAAAPSSAAEIVGSIQAQLDKLSSPGTAPRGTNLDFAAVGPQSDKLFDESLDAETMADDAREYVCWFLKSEAARACAYADLVDSRLPQVEQEFPDAHWHLVGHQSQAYPTLGRW